MLLVKARVILIGRLWNGHAEEHWQHVVSKIILFKNLMLQLMIHVGDILIDITYNMQEQLLDL